ncbi:MAG: hypothetical protein AAF715_30095 [Myxococcota bacterium]
MHEFIEPTPEEKGDPIFQHWARGGGILSFGLAVGIGGGPAAAGAEGTVVAGGAGQGAVAVVGLELTQVEVIVGSAVAAGVGVLDYALSTGGGDSDEATVSEPFYEEFDSLEAATGQLELVNVSKVGKTKNEEIHAQGYTEFWMGQNPHTGEWWSGFKQPGTNGKFVGGHFSSRNR